MALILDLNYLQQNDAKALRFDDSTTVDASGWNMLNIEVTHIDGTYNGVTGARTGTYTLELHIDITTSDSTTTSYDGIDLLTDFGGGAFLVPGDLVFDVNCSHLKEAGVAIGDSDDELPDGIWDITYQVYRVGVGVYGTAVDEPIMVDGVVRNKVYTVLRDIPEIYEDYDLDEKDMTYHSDYRSLHQALLKYGMFQGMLATISDARRTEVLNILETLEGLTADD